MGYSDIDKFHSLVPRKNFESGLRLIKDVRSVQKMIKLWADKIYIEQIEDV